MKFFTNFHVLHDGFGETLRFVLYSILYAEKNGLVFHYTPFQQTMEHNYENDPLFLQKKEELMRFHLLFPPVQASISYASNVSKFDLIHFFDTNIDSICHSPVLHQLRNVLTFQRTRPRPQPYAAIHIRRMNQRDKQSGIKTIEGCDVPDPIYSQVCEILHQLYPEMEIHVFSQGNQQDFTIQSPAPIVWHLDEPIESTFLDMVFSDLLVVAPSAFSYMAGIFSQPQKEVWFIQSCLQPLPHWKPVVGYTSTRDKYRFSFRMGDNKISLLYDPKTNLFFSPDTNQEFNFV